MEPAGISIPAGSLFFPVIIYDFKLNSLETFTEHLYIADRFGLGK